jgi:ataxia telangiectasia mutated family protein
VLESLKDKTWHNIYEALFQCATIERSAYLKTNHSQRIRSVAMVGRLSTCAKVLRITVTAGLRTIRAKTVKALIEHIIDTLPTADGAYCEGLNLDYVKCLRILSEYQPHVEHLRDSWNAVVDFCLDGIAQLQDRSQDGGLAPPNSNATSSGRAPNGSMSLSRRSRAGTPMATSRNQISAVFRREVDDLIACIRHLTRATNVPLVPKAGAILDALVQYLKGSETIRMGHYDAFASINIILSRISHHSIDTTRTIVLDLYPVIKDLWPTKTSGLKDEMLMTLILTKTHVSALLQHSGEATFKEDLENLLETLQSDYSKRLERDQLQVDDLEMLWQSQSENPLLETAAFCLRRGNIGAESQWTTVYFISLYSHLLDANKRESQSLHSRHDDDKSVKRPRVSYLYQDYLRQATMGSIPSQICALQALAFLPHFSVFTEEQLSEYIESLSTIITESNGGVSSWAMLALSW